MGLDPAGRPYENERIAGTVGVSGLGIIHTLIVIGGDYLGRPRPR